jgi:hypothetical protein
MKIIRPTLAIATAAILAASLTGCVGQILEQVTSDGIENLIEEQTGSDIDLDTSGEGNLSLPEGWPAEVPVPDGNIYYSQATDNVYLISLYLPDAAAAQAGYQVLLDSGFTETAQIAVAEGTGFYAAESDTLVVGYNWQTSDDGRAVLEMNVAVKQ